MPRVAAASAVLGVISLTLVSAALLIWWRFDRDIEQAGTRVAQGSMLIATRCGPIGYTASRIAGAKFVGFDEGGHTWIGHHDEIQAEILKPLAPQARR